MNKNKLLTLILTATLATSGIASTSEVSVVRAASTQVTSAKQAIRISGQDRYETAAKVAASNWSTSDNVVLVSGEGYADAISASVLAKKLDAPVLLTNSKTLNSYAKAALSTLKAKNVYVIGGEASISKDVRDALKSTYSITELGGANRYETNAAVAEKLVNLGVDPTNAILVGGQGFSDALTAASIASAKGEILLLGNNDLNSIKSIQNFVNSHKSKVTVIGTDSIINDNTYKTVNGNNRITGGKDRFDTNLKVLESFKGDIKGNKVYVANASGNDYADALVASALAGKNNSPLVLVDSENSNGTANAINYLKSNLTASSDIEVLGGKGVVPDGIINKINNSIPFNNNPEPQAQLNSIKITSPATKLDYTVGDKLDITGLKVTGTYSDNTTKDESITEANISGFDSSKVADEQTLTITVDGKTATYTITVKDSASQQPTQPTQTEQTFTGYITTEDDVAADLGEDTAYMIYMKLMAQSGLGITFQKDGKWVFYYFDGNIATNNKSGADGKWTFDGTGSQLNAWNLVKAQVEAGNPQSPVPVTVTGTLKGNTQTNPGPDADDIDYPVITVNSITVNK